MSGLCDEVFSLCLCVPPPVGGVAAAAGGNGLTPAGGKPKHQRKTRSSIFNIQRCRKQKQMTLIFPFHFSLADLINDEKHAMFSFSIVTTVGISCNHQIEDQEGLGQFPGQGAHRKAYLKTS